jgi:Glycosyltransferase family 87
MPTGQHDGWRKAMLIALAVVLALLAFRAAGRPGVDIAVFHRAGARYASGTDLYLTSQGEQPFRYAPGISALFAPLAALPFPAVRAPWAALSAALAFLAALVLDRRVGERSAFAVPLAWLCLLQPLAQELAHGQVDVAVLALALTAFALEDRGSPLSAGALVAVAAALKVAPAVLALDWIARRRWRPLAGAALGALALAALLVPRYGLAGALGQHVRWVTTQSSDVSGLLAAHVSNQSLWAMAERLGFGKAAGALASALVVAVALTSPDAARRRWLLLAAVPLVSAYGWPQLFILAVPLLAEVISGGNASAAIAGAAAGAISVLGYDVAGRRVEEWAQRNCVLGALLLAVVIAGRVARATPSPQRAAIPVEPSRVAWRKPRAG